MSTATRYQIFLSYRKEGGGEDFAANIYNGLKQLNEQHGGYYFFYDNESIQAGDQFGEKIDEALVQTKVFLPLIHSDDWFLVKGPENDYQDQKRRIFQEEDWVRKEIRTALESQCPIIPVVSSRVTKWPKNQQAISEAAPEDIQGLFSIQYFLFSTGNSSYDIPRLFDRIKNNTNSPSRIKAGYKEPKKSKQDQKNEEAIKQIRQKENKQTTNSENFRLLMDRFLNIFGLSFNDLDVIKDGDRREIYYYNDIKREHVNPIWFEPLSISTESHLLKSRIKNHLKDRNNIKTRTFLILYDIFESIEIEGERWPLKEGIREKINKLENDLNYYDISGTLFIPRIDDLFGR